MAAYSSTVLYNNNILYIRDLTVNKIQGTKKQVMGKTIVKIDIPGLNTYQDEIQINGIIFDTGTTADNQRDNLLTAQDGAHHAYVDGKHDGNFYIMNLTFDDSGDKPNHYTYFLTLTEH